jgi:hypothetical protein
MPDDKYLEVVPASRVADGNRALEQWLHAKGISRKQINPYLRTEWLRTNEGTLIRHFVDMGSFEKSTISPPPQQPLERGADST